MTKKDNNIQDKKNRKTTKRLVITAVIMFGFCFALVPMYSIICDATGLNGKTDGKAKQEYLYYKPDLSRTVTVEFDSEVNGNIPYEFKPTKKKVKIHPGERTSLQYYVKNLTNKDTAVQARPSVTPGLAAKHVKKIECFCFTRQELKAKEEKYFPLTIVINPALPKKVNTLTLSYALYEDNGDK